jgi:predicted DNA-binding transcriptional regulator AlpA
VAEAFKLISVDQDRLLNVEQVAAMLAMSPAWVRQPSNGFRRPAIPSIKLGKSIRFRRQDVLEFVRSLVRCA